MICKGKYTAIILAGGKSSRMGTSKAFLPINGKPAVENTVNLLNPYFDEILISANDQKAFNYLDKPVIEDVIKEQGPLAGIYSALQHSKNEKNFVIACDIPEINMDFVEIMLDFSKDFDIVIPLNNDKFEPLFAVYSKQVIPVIEQLLQTESRKMINLLPMCRTKVIQTKLDSWYKNLNAKCDYEKYLCEVQA